jgi:hypothetical protein
MLTAFLFKYFFTAEDAEIAGRRTLEEKIKKKEMPSRSSLDLFFSFRLNDSANSAFSAVYVFWEMK